MKFTKLLVPVNGYRVDDEVVRLACTVAKQNKAQISIVYVIEVKRSLPLDAEDEAETRKGEQVLSRAEGVARTLDYEVGTEILQAREVGPAVVDEAVERGVDLIVMGIDYKKRFGEFDMGTAVPYVFKNAPCRILLWREPIEQGQQ